MILNFSSDLEKRRRRDETIKSGSDVEPGHLKVDIAELYARDNSKEHHTELYELVNDASPTPVLRRGLSFYFALRFDRAYDATKDSLRLQFDLGPRPAVTKETRVVLPVTDKKEMTSQTTQWDVKIHREDDKTVTLQVKIPATAQVGLWRCLVQTGFTGSDVKNDFLCKDDIYILFNPWCPDDAVFMDHEDNRKEYVLNETGKVWTGSARKPLGRRWIFGQFDDAVLPGAMYLLELSKLSHAERGSPVKIARAISAVINANDDLGLLVGNWSNDYRDGVAPHSWTGSVAIFEQYLKSGGRPVKYGQCWVFSATTVTVCRTLGIPCRSVTNYVSAHDTDSSLTVDKYFDIHGEEIQGGPDGHCSDSCWNYHVWNDVWMSRPDLPKGNGGWQVIDATPQEQSDALFRCGPASVEAVKRGKVGLAYDTPFIFAEVNADVCHFQEDTNSDWGFSALNISQYTVGKRLVTKRVGVDDDEGDADLEDITDQYKYTEGSELERLTVLNAVRGVEKAKQYYNLPKEEEEDISFSLVEIDTVPYGEGFAVTVHLHNKSEEARTVSAVLSAGSVYYTGVTVHLLKRAQRQFVLQPNQREVLQADIGLNEYLDKMVDHGLVKIYAMANVQETKQTWGAEDDFSFKKPKLNVQGVMRWTGQNYLNIEIRCIYALMRRTRQNDLKIRIECNEVDWIELVQERDKCVQDPPRVGQESQVTFSFLNPLPVLLTECQFTIEGHGLQRPKNVNYSDVKPEAGAPRTTQERTTTDESYQTKQTNKARTSYVFPAHSPPLWVVCSPVRSTKDFYHNLVKTPARSGMEEDTRKV
uniref:protein-glutamine gamma-glutamyltransferase n=1 Tax=Timema genevievae TaxID=629358 RepID=A0A7R9PGD4_TIMGE|nr:unnamed protein product [Timema genevievae]